MGYIVVIMFISALMPKARMSMIVSALGILMVYPVQDAALFILLFTFPVALVAEFRE